MSVQLGKYLFYESHLLDYTLLKMHMVRVKLVSHWNATILELVGDKGLRYKRDFCHFHIAVTLDFVISTYIQLY